MKLTDNENILALSEFFMQVNHCHELLSIMATSTQVDEPTQEALHFVATALYDAAERYRPTYNAIMDSWKEMAQTTDTE